MQRTLTGGRTFLAGKIISNHGQSSIDCVVRRMSDDGASLEVANPIGIPHNFHLLIPGEGDPRPCKLIWQSDRQLGLSFDDSAATKGNDRPQTARPERRVDLLRDEMLALRAALDEVEIGIILLDRELRATFINRAFRKMWALPDSKADSKPAFVALMYHGRDTRAYEVAHDQLDSYVANRVRLVKEGNTASMDLRRSNGEVIRMQCAVLPNGGRMLSYTTVTDIVRHSDELEVLKTALDNVKEGVVLLDADLNARFMNHEIRRLWNVSDEQADSAPAYATLIANAPYTATQGVPPEEIERFFARRIALVRAGDPTPCDLHTTDGLHMRAQCAVLPDGGRMLTYCDVTDIIENGRKLEELATTDSMTGLFNRRRFLELAGAEWDRFQRYHRPLSMLMVDIDHFKSVNDRFGHATGDHAIVAVAAACREINRSSDLAGRFGGEEFVLLLPETDLAQASVVAARICKMIAAKPLSFHKVHFNVTVSIGVATASVSMSGIDALLRAADDALYQAKSNGRNRYELMRPMVEASSKLAAE